MQVFVCPSSRKKKDVYEKISIVIEEVKSWWLSRDDKTQNSTLECFMKEQRKAGQQLFCKGRESEETISVLRQNIMEPICRGSDSFFCKLMMWFTETEQTKFAVNFMNNTTYCNDSRKLNSENVTLRDRSKRQYDMESIYNVYKQIFCIKDVSLPVTLEGRPVEMHFLIVIMRFRGVACCLLQFTSTEYSSI